MSQALQNLAAEAAFLPDNNRFTGVIVKNLTPEIKRAVEALWAHYEALDLELITTLRDAEMDLLAAMPVIDGFENEIRQLTHELTSDLRANFIQSGDSPIRLRFAYQGKDELLERLLSPSAGRLVVMPVENEISVHTNVSGVS